MRVLGYVRVSTDAQNDEGHSIGAQRAKLEAYAVAHDLELVDIIEDAASGKTLEREGFRAALRRLESGEAGGILVAKLDRLTRSVRDLGALVDERGPFARFALLSVSDHIDTRTASGRLVLHVLASVAQWEREQIAERTRDALAEMRRKGTRLGGGLAPYGCEWAGRGAGRRWVIVPEELRVIRMIKAAKVQGLNNSAIARWLIAQGIPTKNGRGTWHSRQIERVLQRANEILALAERGGDVQTAVQSAEVVDTR